MKKNYFSFLEISIAVFILALASEVIFNFVIFSSKASQYHSDSLAVCLSLESSLNRLNPQKYTVSQLQEILTQEAAANDLKQRGITWDIKVVSTELEVAFSRNGKVLYKTILVLP